MITRAIVCTVCGKEGKIEVPGRGNPDDPRCFRALGHDPQSGYMHYRCPSCNLVLRVEPMAILSARGTLRGNPRLSGNSRSGRDVFVDLLQSLHRMGRFLRAGR